MEVLVQVNLRGPKLQFDGLDEAIALVRSESTTEQKKSNHKSGSTDTSNAVVLHYTSATMAGRMSYFFSEIETILFVRKLMKSSLLRVKSIHGSA